MRLPAQSDSQRVGRLRVRSEEGIARDEEEDQVRADL